MSEHIRATAIIHEDRFNFQSNFAGTPEKCIKTFREESAKRSVLWAKLFREDDGTELDFYKKDS